MLFNLVTCMYKCFHELLFIEVKLIFSSIIVCCHDTDIIMSYCLLK